jgi:hypothetical protein
MIANMVANGTLTSIPVEILNSSDDTKTLFINVFIEKYNGHKLTKKCLASINFLKK